jgi:glyoxylase-like metal-dependent hydrolase (beta-lactamase superfamily II)
MQIATPETWYETASVGDGVTHIWEPHILPWYRCNIWHVRGRDRDMLVDSGMGVVSLRERVPLVTERKLLAVASHTHFDHIGTHHEFANRLVHPAESHVMSHPTRANTVADKYVTDEIFTALPPGDYDSARYNVVRAPATGLIEEGDTVDLGDRHFEVLHLPGHSPGSIALWEKATGILFSGDVIYDGDLAYDNTDSDIADYISSAERVRALPVRIVHGGHFASFGRARLVELCDAFIGLVGK